jgi:two-component system, OmpR family, phosphate regulon sensor histidine kinase PhoR
LTLGVALAVAAISLAAVVYLAINLQAAARVNQELVTAAREARSRAEDDVLAARAYYDDLLDRIPAAVIIVGASGKVRYANKAAESLLITPKRDVKTTPLSRFSVDFELAKQMAEALKGRRVIKEIHIKKPFERTIRAAIQPIEAAGAENEVVAVLEDVTELRRLETARQELVTSFSHELRTPIAANRATLETLLDMGADDDIDERRRFLRNLRVQTEHLSNLVNEMLQLSRLESGDAIAKPRKEAADSLVEEAVAAVAVLAEAKGVVIETAASSGIAAKADRQLFVQALINLLDNAIKYTDQGGLVRISASGDGGNAVFVVNDTGRGIPKTAVNQVFGRFYRVDKHRSRDAGGTGLGLAITKHIVEAHGGTIEVASVLHEGTTFTITIPAA